MTDSVEVLDELLGSGTEEAVHRTAYKQGYDEGSQEGSQEGWSAGLKTEADLGFELGKYKGFAIAVRKHVLKPGREDVEGHTQNRIVKLCEKIIKLVDDFNWENVTSIHDASSQVRMQYNLLRSHLGVTETEGQEGEGSIPRQRFSF